MAHNSDILGDTTIMLDHRFPQTINIWNVLACRLIQNNIYFIQNKKEHWENNLQNRIQNTWA